MKQLLTVIAVLLFGVACEKSVEFECRVVECNTTNITATSVTLEATVNASNYEDIERMGFMLYPSGSEKYDMYVADKGRMIEVTIDELSPDAITNLR